MSHRTRIIGVALASLLPGAGLAVASHHEVAGAWNITVGEPPHDYPSWIKVEWKAGKHVATFLGRAGSPHDIGEIQFENPKVTFDAHGRKWTGTVSGDRIEGTSVDGDGNKAKWVARRSDMDVDLNGTWLFHVPDDELFETKVALEIEQEDEEIEGELIGLEREVSDLELDGNTFTFYIDPGFNSGESGRGIKATIKGDKMVGTVIGMDGTESKMVAERQREWGEPIELFNGKNLDGWKPLGNTNDYHWKVIDGVMVNKGGGGSANIVSEKKFGDFKAHIEFKVPEGGNSGVYLRGRYEVQVADSAGSAPSPGMCGALYGRIVPAINAAKPAGEWQTFDITLVGGYVTVIHNGRTIIDNEYVIGITGGAIDSHEDEPGPIYLQGDHGEIAYRKITITPAK